LVLVDVGLLFNDQQEIVSYIMSKTIYFRWDDIDVRFVSYFYNTCTMYFHFIYTFIHSYTVKHIGSVMVSVLTSSVVDRGFESRSFTFDEMTLMSDLY
jgi:hypothetical protein